MNKQTLFVTLSAAVLVCGCQSSKVKISGRFVGSDAKNVYLEDASPLTQAVIDSAVLAGDGSYRFELKGVPKTPSLYNIIYNGERIPLLIAGGDRVTVGSVGSVVRNYTVEGSAESELLRQFYQEFVTGAQRRRSASRWSRSTRLSTTASAASSCGSSSRTSLRWRRSTPSTSVFRGTVICSTATATWSISAPWPKPSKRAIPIRPISSR